MGVKTINNRLLWWCFIIVAIIYLTEYGHQVSADIQVCSYNNNNNDINIKSNNAYISNVFNFCTLQFSFCTLFYIFTYIYIFCF